VAPGSKPEGVIHLIYENVNGLNNRLSGNEKVEKAKEIQDELEVDIVAYKEHRLNMQDRRNVNGFNQLFKGGEAAVQSVVAHNVHENFGRVQEGGTSVMAFGPILEYLVHDQPGKDETGLGRWSVMTFKGENSLTRVVCGYNLCYNSKPDSSTSYQQHRRYFITQRKDLTCPRTRFREDLVAQLRKWREDGDKLIVCLDSNEHIYHMALGKALTDIYGLAMKEVVGEFTGTPIGSTFFRGSKPIDGIWATSDVTVNNAAIMPAGY
jgi:exonuclease III